MLNDFGEAIPMEDSFVTPYPAGFSPGGAPKFLPPEIMLAQPGRNSTLDYTKSDVFGAGMVFYQMMQGVDAQPFGSDDHRNYTLPNFVEPSECYDEDIRTLVREMLSPDPQQRLLPKRAREILFTIDARV